MIELKNLTAGYSRQNCLTGLDLLVEDGKLTVLLGPNGCGKSMLLKTIAGILPVYGGEILVDGLPVSQMSSRQLAQRVSYMAQTRNTPNIVARRMVLHGRFPYLSYPRRYSRADHELARQALQAADALDIADRPMPELSGGQRQKVYLAMALAQDTNTILMDEPMNFLDVQHQLGLIRTAHDLAAAGKAVLLVMHDIRLAMQCADSLVIMSDRGIGLCAPAQEVYASGLIDEVFKIKLCRMETPAGWQYFYL